MADAQSSPIWRHICKRVGAPADGELSDARLLQRFAHEHDQEAFEALLRRHSPLVWRVCRRVLVHGDAAEDAFQATLLVFARRAGAIRKPASLASWLHGVAYRIARRARVDNERRRRLDRGGV